MKNQIIQLIAQEANRSATDFTSENTLTDDLMLGELELLSLQLAIEDDLDITLNDDAWSRCKTVQDVIDLVGHQLATH